MPCFKLLGNRVAARTFDRQITELKVRAAILNRFSRMGTPVTVRIA
jgi:chromosome condensin MukBEF MukE localization factor